MKRTKYSYQQLLFIVNDYSEVHIVILAIMLFDISIVKIVDSRLYFLFSFHFILFLFLLYFTFLFLEQLRLGYISHDVTLVTN